MISYSRAEAVRFLKYAVVGVSTFLVDIGMLYALVEWLGIDYRLAAGLSFLAAVSINYCISRVFVFAGTHREFSAGYVLFISIACLGALFTALATWAIVYFVGMYYMVSRVIVGAVLGIGTYTLNAGYIFNVKAK